eukprot:129334_1
MFTACTQACTQVLMHNFGVELHQSLKQHNSILSEPYVQESLIKMYGEFGKIDICEEIFNDIKTIPDDTRIWVAMLDAYGKNGYFRESLNIYHRLKNKTTIMFDVYIFISLLKSCNYSGNIEEAINIWTNEINDDTLRYDKFVIATLVDGFAKKERLSEALQLICKYENKTNDTDAHAPMWRALLTGCAKYNYIKMAEHVYYKMKERFDSDQNIMAGINVLMSDMYGANAEYEKQDQIMCIMKEKGHKRKLADSTI